MIARLAARFREAWLAADAEGAKGKRVERGLDAVLFDAVFAYSEWLDGEGLVVGDAESNDSRTHEELVIDFLNERVRGD